MEPFRFKKTTENLIVLYGGRVFLKLHLGTFKLFSGDLLVPKLKRVKKKVKLKDKKKKEWNAEQSAKVKQIAKAYANAKAKYYKNSKLKKTISIAGKNEGHFIKAIAICEKNKLTYKKYIKAQIMEMGKFPYIVQLQTDNAELRALEYFKVKKKDKEKIRISLSQDDKNLDLVQNGRYVVCRDKIKEKVATKVEAIYVAVLQKFKTGRVNKRVQEYVDSFDCE